MVKVILTANFSYENIESKISHKVFNSQEVYLKVTARGQNIKKENVDN